jgi:hypothetical protein
LCVEEYDILKTLGSIPTMEKLESKEEIYIEVTRRDGTVSVMKAKDFSRLSAMELAYTSLKVVKAPQLNKP